MSRRSLNGMWKFGNREGCKRKIRGRKLTVILTMIVKHLENSGGEKRRQLSQCVQTAGVQEGGPGLGREIWEPSTTECCHLGDGVDRKAGFWVTPVLSSQEKQRYNHLMMKGCELSWKMISWYRVLREGDLRLSFPLAALLSDAGSARETSGEIFSCWAGWKKLYHVEWHKKKGLKSLLNYVWHCKSCKEVPPHSHKNSGYKQQQTNKSW